jgi:hypothetical protein
MIADAMYLAFAGFGPALDLCHAACRSMLSGGLKAATFGRRPRIWPWSRSRNHRAAIKSP